MDEGLISSPAPSSSKRGLLICLLGLGVGFVFLLGFYNNNATPKSNRATSFILQEFPIYINDNELTIKEEGTSNIQQNGQQALPTVLTHGFGDACVNPGFSQLVSMIRSRTHSEAYCFADGVSFIGDSINGILLPMNDQVEHFAKFVRSKTDLSGGFNAMGLSQGNLIIRGYISKYNDPPVINFVSIHGPHAGVASLPHCDPVPESHLTAELCDDIDNDLNGFVYTDFVQNLVAQSNFFRNPLANPQYLAHCHFLPYFLDKAKENPKIQKNFASLNKLALIMADSDTMIYPKESEWFGAFEDGAWAKIIPGEEQPFYDAVGLKELDRLKRVSRLTTHGDHLQFNQIELYKWIDDFFLSSPE